MAISMQAAIEKLKKAAGSIRSKDDAIQFLITETGLPKAECEKAFEAVAKVDFKDLADKLPEGITDKIPSGITKKFGL